MDCGLVDDEMVELYVMGRLTDPAVKQHLQERQVVAGRMPPGANQRPFVVRSGPDRRRG